MATTATTPTMLHRRDGEGEMYIGPGDFYRFLVTGEETGGAYFAMEAIVPPGGGPPPHTHRDEDETFYVVEGGFEFLLGDRIVTAGVGDFVNVPRGMLHRFKNASDRPARMILTVTPSGIEHFFRECLARAPSADQPTPDNVDEVAARYAEAGPRYGMEFFV